MSECKPLVMGSGQTAAADVSIAGTEDGDLFDAADAEWAPDGDMADTADEIPKFRLGDVGNTGQGPGAYTRFHFSST